MNKLTKLWSISSKAIAHIEEEKKTYRLKHGMLASIPLLCKGEMCPFIETCRVPKDELEEGGRCLTEISAILSRFEDLCAHFEIDTAVDTIEPENVVDVSLIKDIVDIEVQILRAENLIARSGDFMAKHIAQIDKFGNAYYEDVIHPSLEYKMKLVEQRTKVLSKLNATRKDKASVDKGKGDYTDKALELIAKVKDKLKDVDLDSLDLGGE